ncbi:MAG: 2,3-bisphosphoglycerate-dependent phosphoglycerate mutase [Parachlamydiales bacterium]|nr:2,3-bisphosphoglycerate-dependent phosphoglycerate mutase [Parachlamydiales bacterium]
MTKKNSLLILMRHGESVWNKRDLFTGWVDVPLSQKGIEEAMEGGKKIKNIPIDLIFTSTLIRAQMTLFLAMLFHESQKTPVLQHVGEGQLEEWGKIHSEEMLKETIPVFYDWHLNERWYGDLQGLNKEWCRQKYGKEQVHTWRRSYDVAPPNGESLEMTAQRTIPYFKEKIFPFIQQGKNVFIAAHGNSLRSIVMFLENLSGEEIVKRELATGIPMLYAYSDNQWEKLSTTHD